ncbi:MAG: hypothetical protein RMI56_00385 [Sulfolobales archaeon]|nr:hypothetical protein [Sulfolobales archaeon]MDW8082236.1 hypothetical protein [Sulfolobales archaeon]
MSSHYLNSALIGVASVVINTAIARRISINVTNSRCATYAIY